MDSPTIVNSSLPQNLHRLPELAQNLWWSWTLEARQLFEVIDHEFIHAIFRGPGRVEVFTLGPNHGVLR